MTHNVVCTVLIYVHTYSTYCTDVQRLNYVLRFIASIFSENYVCTCTHVRRELLFVCVRKLVCTCVYIIATFTVRKGMVTGEKNSDPEPELGGSLG